MKQKEESCGFRGKGISGRRDSKCKVPEVEMHLVCLKSNRGQCSQSEGRMGARQGYVESYRPGSQVGF